MSVDKKIFYFLLMVTVLLIGGLLVWQTRAKESLKPIQSGFQAALEETKKKEEEKRKEEERKRQEEETKAFIAQYGPCRNIPILMYHHVDDNPPAGGGWLYVRKDYFSQQMDELSQKGYQTVTLAEVVDNLQTGKSLPPKSAVLTFDDGYRDFYENAYPILKAYNFKATVFVISQYLGGNGYLTWEQLKEMQSSGLVTVGDHTLSHPSLPVLTEEKLKNEIISAKNILVANLGVGINFFAYPFGGFNGEVEKILKEGGFVAAVTTKRGLSCAKLPYELPRVRIGNAPLQSYGF